MDDQPAVPRYPLWDGIYDFAFWPTNVKTFVGTFLCLLLLSFCACGLYTVAMFLAGLPQQTALLEYYGMGVMVAARLTAGFVVLSFFLTIYPCACFMRIVESTAAGLDYVQWNQGVWIELVKDMFFLVWIAVCSIAVPGAFLAFLRFSVPISVDLWWIILSAGFLTLFPIFLLSTMLANQPWALLSVRVINRLIEEPATALALYLHALAFGVPLAVLVYWMFSEPLFALAPLAGLYGAAYWLSYARLLGRVGWLVTEERVGARRRGRESTRRTVKGQEELA